jgi:hypothetical protein
VIDSGDRSDQVDFEKRKTPDRPILDVPFPGNRIQGVSDQKKSLMPPL